MADEHGRRRKKLRMQFTRPFKHDSLLPPCIGDQHRESKPPFFQKRRWNPQRLFLPGSSKYPSRFTFLPHDGGPSERLWNKPFWPSTPRRLEVEVVQQHNKILFDDGVHEPFSIDTRFTFLSKIWQSQERKKNPSRLLSLPPELLCHIFSYLAEDLEVAVHEAGVDASGWHRPFSVVLSNPRAWQDLMAKRRVSKRVREHVQDAQQWAAWQKDRQIVIDIRKAAVEELPEDIDAYSLRLPPAPASRYPIPPRILAMFRSLRFCLPVSVESPDEHIQVKLFNFTFEKSTEAIIYELAEIRQSSFWTDTGLTYCRDAIPLAVTFDEVEANFRSELTARALSLNTSAASLYQLVMVLGVNALMDPDKWPNYAPLATWWTLRQVLPTCDPRKRIPELNGMPFKLGWHGAPPTHKPKTVGDGESFMVKWRPCAELIKARRWEEPKIIKLGWRGSRILADARRQDQELEGDEVSQLANWLENLEVPSERELIDKELQMTFEIVVECLQEMSRANEENLSDATTARASPVMSYSNITQLMHVDLNVVGCSYTKEQVQRYVDRLWGAQRSLKLWRP
ncbi:uncharacterized protein RCC_08729 [Ramularia collo-cygni]|uniref:Uncharacterized protein n=1 Tax=Ramularia collo-cygni TaxID=112498 RepID=A0A2D3VIG3_9PEZI|nr:uncharacterized protein RCC_08729 [Ramularia collo-cygni]CZT23019.1 uncharacterized protein RCC_08729 [Ramularia collo-cygni]